MSSLEKTLHSRDTFPQHTAIQESRDTPPSIPYRRPAPIPLASTAFREEDEYDHALDYSSGSSSASSAASVDTIVPTHLTFRRRKPPSQTEWTDFFEEEMYLETDEIFSQGSEAEQQKLAAKYHVYLTRPANPAKDVLFLCHHGAGSCGLSFALLARELRKRLPTCGILSVEAREHGSVVFSAGGVPTTHESSKSEEASQSVNSAALHAQMPDFSMQTLTSDFMLITQLVAKKLQWSPSSWPPTILVGHSLGGAVVTRVASSMVNAETLNLAGYCVIDVVEGSAMDALKSMQAYLASRPASFASVEGAVDWHVRSRTVRNRESASISTPPLLVPQDLESGDGRERWVWRTDLASTSEYWEDWFGGMSAAFLSGKAAKLLVLAGTDRLDKELMIGHMQGKFQLVVVPEAGHFVQEDVPDKTADTLVDFWRRNDRSALVLPPKVSDLLKAGKKV